MFASFVLRSLQLPVSMVQSLSAHFSAGSHGHHTWSQGSEEKAGAAAAVFGASEFLFAFIVSTIVLEWRVVSTLPLAITLILLGGASAFVLVFFKKYK